MGASDSGARGLRVLAREGSRDIRYQSQCPVGNYSVLFQAASEFRRNIEVSASGHFLSGICIKTLDGCFDRLGAREKFRLQNALHRMGPSCPDKVSIAQLQRIAQKRGLKLTEVHLNWMKLQTQLSRPVLLVLRNGNVVVALRSEAHSNNRIVVFDPLYPTGQDFWLPKRVLESTWDGDAILVDRSPSAYNLLAQFASAMPTLIVLLGFFVFWPTVVGDEYPRDTPVQQFQQLHPEVLSIVGSILYISPNTRTQHESSSVYKRLGLATGSTIDLPAETVPDVSDVVSPLASNSTARLEISKANAGLPIREGAGTRHAPGAKALEQTGRDSELQSRELQILAPPAPAGLDAAARGPENLRSVASSLTSELAAHFEESDGSGVEARVALPGHPDRSAGAPEISALMARGDELFRIGDLASARLFYERAVDAGHRQAALRLGESYDPSFLALNGIPVRGDAVLAARWYKRAIDFGVPAGDILLNGLAR
jgi:hypothetical protein